MFSAASLTRSMRRCCCCAKTAPRYSALTSASACTQPAPVRRCWSACDDKSTAKSDARRFSCKRELITKRCWLAVWVRQEKVTVDTRRRFFAFLKFSCHHYHIAVVLVLVGRGKSACGASDWLCSVAQEFRSDSVRRLRRANVEFSQISSNSYQQQQKKKHTRFR